MAADGETLMAEDEADQPTRAERGWAFSVHLFTAAGAALGFLAMHAAVSAQWSMMFVWLGIALVVDGIDGTFARRLNVAERLPRWSGETLDLVIDFVTYVFVPAYAIATAGLMPYWLAILAGLVIVVTSALYFADKRMKTDDNYFRGFPAVWNTVAFYLLLLRPNGWVSAAVVAGLAVLTFVPVAFVHPFRVVRLRILSIVLLATWSVLAIVAIARDMAPEPWIIGGLCGIGLYFLGIGLLRRPD